MRKICAWCGKELEHDNKDVPQSNIVSHGICKDCKIKMEYNNIPIDSFINKFPMPILVVDKMGELVALNKKAEKSLHKTFENVKGTQGGEIIECVYSSIPEGCGNTIHCSGCTIRNSVNDTFISGKPIIEKKAYKFIQTSDGIKEVELLISTEKFGENIILKIHSIEG